MIPHIGTVATVALLAGIAVLPAPASAASANRSYQFQTRMVEQAPSVGEFDGSLKITISPDGIVSGYYRPDDNPRFISVTGGVTGEDLWFEIDSFARRPWRFSGTLTQGTIRAVSSDQILDNNRLTSLDFIGTSKPNAGRADDGAP